MAKKFRFVKSVIATLFIALCLRLGLGFGLNAGFSSSLNYQQVHLSKSYSNQEELLNELKFVLDQNMKQDFLDEPQLHELGLILHELKENPGHLDELELFLNKIERPLDQKPSNI